MTQERILVVDDAAPTLRLVCDRLRLAGYHVCGASDGHSALSLAQEMQPDLVLLDVLMPGLDGFEVCRQLRAAPSFATTPIVLLTSLDATDDRVRGLDSGADEFLCKPIVAAELLARVRSLLRSKTLHDTVLRQREELARWSATLERRVAEEVARSERLTKLTRFFSPSLASRLVADSDDDPLRSHKREVTVLFADLRGFTRFAESVSAEDMMTMLGEFHECMGPLITELEGTLERFTGDGMMVFFNDPDPVPDHTERAVHLALGMQLAMPNLLTDFRTRHGLAGLAVGISRGVATLGAIGSSSRLDYAAIGSVTNRAARLCQEAAANDIVLCQSTRSALGESFVSESLGAVSLKGFARPAEAFRLVSGHPRD